MSNGKLSGNTAVLDAPVRVASRAAKGPDKANLEAVIASISKSQAMIEFRMDGTIVTANENFLNAVGYTLGEIQGRHHSIFVNEMYARNEAYGHFWADLNRGRIQSGEYELLGKSGKVIWLQGSYNPVLDNRQNPCKVIQCAINVTDKKLQITECAGIAAAIGKSRAVLELRLDGTIISANEKFLNIFGYSLDAVSGKPESIFLDDSHATSKEYRDLWEGVNRGEYQSGTYKRLAKGGQGNLGSGHLQPDSRPHR